MLWRWGEELKPTLLVMIKAPRIGRGKSRLAAEIGRVEAWRINRALHRHTFHIACDDPRWRTIMCVAPDRSVRAALPGIWPAHTQRAGQGTGDLGERLARALGGRRNVAVIGADCPELRRRHIASAFGALKRKAFVLGPAVDGGFWLLAARRGRDAAMAMAGVRWSTRHAARDVIRNLGAANVALIDMLRDIDTLSDLRRGL